MKNYFASCLFFLVFFRISFWYSSLSASIIIGVVGVLYILKKKNIISRYLRKKDIYLGLLLAFMLFYATVLDISGDSGAGISNLFSVRLVAIVVMSIAPAALVQGLFVKGRVATLRLIVFYVFSVQLIIWVLTYISSDAKFFAYAFLGASDSVNLRSYNLHVRGFGLSNEMNFTTPFMMTIVALLFLKRTVFGILVFFSQLVNSNLTVVAGILGFLHTNISYIKKVSILICVSVVVVYYSEYFLSRLIAEFQGTQSQTVNALLTDHLVFMPNDIFSKIFGGGYYVFQTIGNARSDIGWVILYNYGGIVFMCLVLLFIGLISFEAFASKTLFLLWFAAGVVLNIKGLIISPNSYLFMTFIFIFLRRNRAIQKSVKRRAVSG